MKEKQDPLILHLKYKYYEMIRSGEKTHEYRQLKPYWNSRIHGQKELILVPGYGNCNSLDLHAKIKNIRIIDWEELPDYAKEEFGYLAYSNWFDIEFEVI